MTKSYTIVRMLSKIIIFTYVLTTSAALIIMKVGAQDGMPISLTGGRVSVNLNPAFLLGMFLYIVSFITYVYLISTYDLGYIVPLLASFVYVLTFTAAYFVFNEVFTLVKLLGIALILVGLILLNMGSVGK